MNPVVDTVLSGCLRFRLIFKTELGQTAKKEEELGFSKTDQEQDSAGPPPGSIRGKAPIRLHAAPTKSMLTEGLPGTRSNDFCVFESRKSDLIFPRL